MRENTTGLTLGHETRISHRNTKTNYTNRFSFYLTENTPSTRKSKQVMWYKKTIAVYLRITPST
jgi:hypothetical protein